MRSIVFSAVMLLSLTACSTAPSTGQPASGATSPAGALFDPNQLVKSDIDRVADAYRQEVFRSLRVLAEKLYRRNPGEWRKSGAANVQDAVERAMSPSHQWRFAELEGRYGIEAIQLAFDENFRGDRVLALIGGLGGMMHQAFEGKMEFYMLDDLDPQKLYNSARNVEIAVWRLSNKRMADGRLFLLSNEAAETTGATGTAGMALAAPPANLSFEREFGKIIGHFDLLSRIIADKLNRTVVKVVQSVATAVFLPVVTLR